MSTKPKPQGEGAAKYESCTLGGQIYAPVAVCSTRGKGFTCYTTSEERAEWIAAKLNSHAQLLEALKLAHSGLDFSIINTKQLEQIEAAIAATGGKG